MIVLRDQHRITPIVGHVYGKWGIRAARCKGKRAGVSRPREDVVGYKEARGPTT